MQVLDLSIKWQCKYLIFHSNPATHQLTIYYAINSADFDSFMKAMACTQLGTYCIQENFSYMRAYSYMYQLIDIIIEQGKIFKVSANHIS